MSKYDTTKGVKIQIEQEPEDEKGSPYYRTEEVPKNRRQRSLDPD